MESPTKGSPSHEQASITPATVKVQETVWVHPHQSASPVEETGDLVEPEPACESVRSHCSEGEASLDTSTSTPLV